MLRGGDNETRAEDPLVFAPPKPAPPAATNSISKVARKSVPATSTTRGPLEESGGSSGSNQLPQRRIRAFGGRPDGGRGPGGVSKESAGADSQEQHPSSRRIINRMARHTVATISTERDPTDDWEYGGPLAGIDMDKTIRPDFVDVDSSRYSATPLNLVRPASGYCSGRRTAVGVLPDQLKRKIEGRRMERQQRAEQESDGDGVVKLGRRVLKQRIIFVKMCWLHSDR